VKVTSLPKGMTLLEILLVITIGAGLLVASLRMAQQMSTDQGIQQIQTNVDVIFQGMTNYYRTQCYGSGDTLATGLPTVIGTLNPKKNPVPANPMILDVTLDLANKGYIEASKWPLPIVSLLDNTSVNQTYVVQFNQSPPMTPVQVNACIITDYSLKECVPALDAAGNASKLPSTGSNISQIIIWRAQVAVLAKDPTNAEVYKMVLGANCTSKLTGSSVNPCSMGTPGPYIVWEKLPSFASPNTRSSLWLSMPLLKQFNLQNTHDQMYELQNSNAGIQNYLCNG
jgi:prepilin-type N-terminal cleavage/methylation domain-containing protein